MGWVWSGPAPEAESACSLLTTHTLRVDAHEEDMRLDDTLFIQITRNIWIQSICPPGLHCTSRCHYEVHLPWRKPRCILPDNYQLSLERLQSLMCRLRWTPDIFRVCFCHSEAWNNSTELQSLTLKWWVKFTTYHIMPWLSDVRKPQKSEWCMMHLCSVGRTISQ